MSTAASLSPPTTAPRSKGLHIALWVVQVLLAVAFGLAGIAKSTSPIEELAKNMSWVPRMSPAMVRFVGVSELLGAIGLVLPSLTRIKPGLSALAGAGLALVMVLAAGHHLMYDEAAALPFNLILGGLAAFVAWGRYKKAPIAPRG